MSYFIAAMSGHPKKKATQAKRMCQHYSKDFLKVALDAVFEGKMSQRVASKIFGIPQPTISDYIRHKQEIDYRKPGCKPVFSQKVEENMVKAASDAAQMGLGLSRYQFMAKVGNVERQLNIKTPWKTAPGPKWLRCMQKETRS